MSAWCLSTARVRPRLQPVVLLSRRGRLLQREAVVRAHGGGGARRAEGDAHHRCLAVGFEYRLERAAAHGAPPDQVLVLIDPLERRRARVVADAHTVRALALAHNLNVHALGGGGGACSRLRPARLRPALAARAPGLVQLDEHLSRQLLPFLGHVHLAPHHGAERAHEDHRAAHHHHLAVGLLDRVDLGQTAELTQRALPHELHVAHHRLWVVALRFELGSARQLEDGVVVGGGDGDHHERDGAALRVRQLLGLPKVDQAKPPVGQ
eukprot:4223152-Pleurochrysis_carterae.AAC.6